MGSPAIFSGDYAKLLKQALRLGTRSSAPSSPATGDIYYDSVINELMRYNGVQWTTVGSTDSSGINYINNPGSESGTSGWATYADAAAVTPVNGVDGTANTTWTRSTSSPLRDVSSFLLTKASGASRQGEGVAYDFTIDSADKGKVLQGSFDYAIDSGTYADDAVRVFIYDVTNAVLIPCTPSLLKNHSLAAEKFGFEFQTASNSTSYRLILHIAGTDTVAYTLKFDNFIVGPQAKLYGSPITDWTSFTPTGTWVTNATYAGRYRRVGDNLEVDLLISVTGAVTAATLDINMPSGFVIDSTKLASASDDYTVVGVLAALDSGTGSFSGAVAYRTSTTVRLKAIDTAQPIGTSWRNLDNGSPITWANGDRIAAHFVVPIVGWGSSAIMSNDASTRVVDFVASRGANQTGVNPNGSAVKIAIDTVAKDSHGGFSTVNNRYSIQVSGDYIFHGSVDVANTNVLNERYTLRFYVNGATFNQVDLRVPVAGTFFYLSGSIVIPNLKAGDYVEAFIFCTGNNSVSTLTIQGGQTYFSGSRISGPSQIAASEKIYAEYTNSAGTSITGSDAVNILPFATKVQDTHSAWSTNVFTAPRNDFYTITTHFNITNMANATRVLVLLQKNSSNFRRLGSLRNSSGGAQTLPNISLTTSLYLLAGETLRVNATMDDATTRALEASGDVNWIVIQSQRGI